MKKILGIIAEYNPFHSGHKYQIERAKALTNADYIICLLSSNFVQRGEPAIFSSYDRAKMALENGVSAVFEMPAYFSTSSAESFAFYGINLFTQLGIDYISFGAENAKKEELELIVSILGEESTNFKLILNDELKKGVSFPKAREVALLNELKNHIDTNFNKILDKPNNILAIEYIKAIKKLNSQLEPIIIKRTNNNYNDISLSEFGFSSATALRKEIFKSFNTNKSYENLKNFIPDSVYKYLSLLKPMSADYILPFINLELTKYAYKDEDLSIFLDINHNISNRILKNFQNIDSYEKLIDILKSKQYTYTRISRCLSHILLDIKKSAFKDFLENEVSYAKLLGFRQEDAALLSLLKNRSKIDIITKEKDAKKLEKKSYALYKHNKFCDKIYNNIYYYNYKENLNLLKNNIFILK